MAESEKERMKAIDELHRRISDFETSHFDREVKKLEDLVRDIAEKERNATSKLIAERSKTEVQAQQNKEFTHEVEKLRKELAASKKMLTEVKQQLVAAQFKPTERSEEVLELQKRLGELTHRLEKRTQEYEQAKQEAENYRHKYLKLESRHGNSDVKVMASLHTSLETQNALTKQVTAELEATRTRAAGLEAALNASLEELENLKSSKKELVEQEQSMEEVHKVLHNDISTLKQQKAKVRCDFLKTRSDLVAAERELHVLQKSYDELVKTRSDAESNLAIERKLRETITAELEASKKTQMELREQLEKAEAESLGELSVLNARIASIVDQNDRLKDFVKQQDKQCDELASQVQFLSDDRDSWQEKCAKKTQDLAEMRKKLTGTELCETEMGRLKEDLGRAKDKISFLEREIKTLHIDYRGELADLTKKLALAQKENFFAAKDHPVAKRFSFADNQRKQLESELATERRLLAEKTAELETLKREKSNDSTNQDMKKKVLDAHKALNEAVNKLQMKNEELAGKESENADLRKELERAFTQIGDLEDELHENRQKNAKIEESMFYWKQLYERQLRPCSDSDAISNYTQDNLHEERDDGENEQPLVEEPMEGHEEADNSLCYGMMRHEIGHSFKRKSHDCAKCRQTLPAISNAMRCRYCPIFAHVSCSRRIGMTCGLPPDYARIYLDAVHRSLEDDQQQLRSARSHEHMDTM